MPSTPNVAIRKRQEIAKANRMMFFWVTGASAIVGIAVVLGLTLFNKLGFNQTVISKQGETVSILTKNKEAANSLLESARVLDTNINLRNSRTKPYNDEDTGLQVILEALPSTENKAALGASLQTHLLKLDGVTIESLSVGDTDVVSDGEAIITGSLPIGFTFTAKATDPEKLFDLLARLESSIRPIKIVNLSVETGPTETTLTVIAESYYQLPVNIDLQQESFTGKGRK